MSRTARATRRRTADRPGGQACRRRHDPQRDPPRWARSATGSLTRSRPVISGKRPVIDLVIAALLADGHVLLEDVPGVGKTSLAKALAAAIDGEFGRIQFTPDLLPTDVSGVTIYRRGRDEFEFRPGPVFANIVLADEINRASPKTQSALLEAMAERQVTVDGTTYQLAAPVPGDRHPEPDRARGHVPAARLAARPLPHAHRRRLPRHRGRAAHAREPRRIRSTRRREAGGAPPPTSSPCAMRPPPSTWPRR